MGSEGGAHDREEASVSPFPSKVLPVARMQALRARVIAGEALAPADMLALLSSHENLRARVLTLGHRSAQLEREVEDLTLMLRKVGAR